MSVEFEGGTKRTERYVPLWLCPVELIQAVADTRLYGDQKYEPGNWMQGDKYFFVDCLSHAIQHLYDYAIPPEGDTSGDYHLGHAATNIAFVLWALKHGVIERRDFFNVAKLLDPTLDGSVSSKNVHFCHTCGGTEPWNIVEQPDHLCQDCVAARDFEKQPVSVTDGQPGTAGTESTFSKLLRQLRLESPK